MSRTPSGTVVSAFAMAVVLAPALVLGLTGCSAPLDDQRMTDSTDSAEAADRVSTCDGRELTFSEEPQRVVALDATAAAFLIELGVGESIVGLSGTDFIGDYTGSLREQLEAIPVLDSDTATQEVVLTAAPDLVIGTSGFEFGQFDGTASVETLEQNGIAALWACNTLPGEAAPTLAATDHFVSALAAIFGVEQTGEQLVRSFHTAIDDAGGTDGAPVSTLLLTGVPADGSAISTRGDAAYANAVLAAAGCESIGIGLPGNIVQLSAEQIVADDPKLIVAVIGFDDQDEPEVRAAIRNSPLLRTTSAVKNDRIVIVPSRILFTPSLLNADAIELIAAARAATE